jgi:hypothetical protein
MRLVWVEWVDSLGCSPSWEPLDSSEPKVLVCQSVGWLIHDGPESKTIVPHLAVNQPGVRNQGCGDMTIPASAVRRILDLPCPN